MQPTVCPVVYVYGVLNAAAPISIPAQVLMGKNLVIRRFSNFNSATVKDPAQRMTTLTELREVIGDSSLRAKVGQIFAFDDIEAAL